MECLKKLRDTSFFIQSNLILYKTFHSFGCIRIMSDFTLDAHLCNAVHKHNNLYMSRLLCDQLQHPQHFNYRRLSPPTVMWQKASL